MRTLIFTSLFMLLISQMALSQNQTVIDSADNLIEKKQYESAFQLLDKEDPENDDIQILIKKTNLLTEYFVTSINHVMFALKDLDEGESVMDYRGKSGNFKMHVFDADSLTRRLIRKEGSDFRLYRNMADYWFSVYLNYGEDSNNRKSPLDTVNKYSRLAISSGDSHFKTYYKRAFCLLMNDKYTEAIPVFEKSIQKNDSFPESHYNLAYAYLQINKFSNALISANRALELYDTPVKKADAARMAGISLMELDKPEKAKMYLKNSLKFAPDNYNTLHNLLEVFFMEDNLMKADSLAKKIFASDPGSPGVAEEIRRIYKKNNNIRGYLDLMRQELKNYDKPKIKGNIYFNMAEANMPEEPDKAKEYLFKAKENFKKSVPGDHYVFNVIDKALQQIEGQENK